MESAAPKRLGSAQEIGQRLWNSQHPGELAAPRKFRSALPSAYSCLRFGSQLSCLPHILTCEHDAGVDRLISLILAYEPSFEFGPCVLTCRFIAWLV
jgi:hypothetical protein